MTASLTDFEIIEALDFEFSPPCDCRKPSPCEREANWVATWRCCGQKWLYCTPHKDSDSEAIKGWLTIPGSTVTHDVCGAEQNTFPYSSVEPL